MYETNWLQFAAWISVRAFYESVITSEHETAVNKMQHHKSTSR